MALKYWDHLKLKNGDKVVFVPPAPNGDNLGGISQQEKESLTKLTNKTSTPVSTGKVWTTTNNGAEWVDAPSKNAETTTNKVQLINALNRNDTNKYPSVPAVMNVVDDLSTAISQLQDALIGVDETADALMEVVGV